jgi:hypothetical protein
MNLHQYFEAEQVIAPLIKLQMYDQAFHLARYHKVALLWSALDAMMSFAIVCTMTVCVCIWVLYGMGDIAISQHINQFGWYNCE